MDSIVEEITKYLLFVFLHFLISIIKITKNFIFFKHFL